MLYNKLDIVVKWALYRYPWHVTHYDEQAKIIAKETGVFPDEKQLRKSGLTKVCLCDNVIT